MSTGFQSRLLNDFDGFKTLGRGGYGLVVSAKHVLDRNEYAIKGIRVKKEKIERVLKEVHAMAKIDHTGFVRYHTSWAEEPPPEFQKSYQTRIEKLIKKGNVANEEHSNLSKPHKFAETIGNSSQGPSGPQRIHKSKSYPLVKNTMTFPQREDSDLTDSESEEGPR
ncbi:unnamed protein product, partial [Mesorhabditis belari]|uniref:Protein kinase domain-containing protein n=1 Tax=Mesorhabditis belari TaxID=2138241 RepID=A0AAF3ELD6_9BILA